MNGTAIPWRIFLYRIPLTRRMKNPILQGWMIPQYRTLKSKLPKYRLKKSSIPEYGKPPCPPLFYIICNFFYWSSTGLLRTIKSFSDDIIMEYGLDKCAKAIFKRGRLADSSNIELDVNTIIQDLDQGGTYKYLGGTRETESSTLRSKRRSGKSTTAGSGWYSSRSWTPQTNWKPSTPWQYRW